MKRVKVFLLLFLGIIAVFILSIVGHALFAPTHYIMETDISKYNEHVIYSDSFFFPEIIPSNAEVVEFRYYEYLDEEQDIFLELKFNSTDEMSAFIKSVSTSTPNGYLYTESNPFDNEYTDIFSSGVSAHSGIYPNPFFYYKVEYDSNTQL